MSPTKTISALVVLGLMSAPAAASGPWDHEQDVRPQYQRPPQRQGHHGASPYAVPDDRPPHYIYFYAPPYTQAFGVRSYYRPYQKHYLGQRIYLTPTFPVPPGGYPGMRCCR